MKLGCHVDGGDNLVGSLFWAARQGLSCVQAFISTPMRLFTGSSSILKDVRQAVKSTGVELIIHGPFVYNLATEDNTKFKQAYGMIKKLMDSASQAGATFVVNHVGSGDLERVREICEYVVKQGFSAKLLLENDSGSKKGTRVGSLPAVIGLSRTIPGLGWCLDTAHAYGDGFDIAAKGPKLVSLAKPDVIHLNDPDPKVKFGEHLDRHNSIFGDGNLGLEPLALIAQAAPDACLIVEAERQVSQESIIKLKTYLSGG